MCGKGWKTIHLQDLRIFSHNSLTKACKIQSVSDGERKLASIHITEREYDSDVSSSLCGGD